MKKFFKTHWLIVGLFVILCCLGFFVWRGYQSVISYVDINGVDKGSVYNTYLATITGSFVAGTITLLGVLLTILYYKQSDYDRRKLEYMPYLMVSRFDESCNLTFLLDVNFEKAEDYTEYNLKVRNIGNQYAQLKDIIDGKTSTIVGYDIVIPKNESIYFRLRISKESLHTGREFIFTFSDAIGNNYAQTYFFNYPNEESEYFDLNIDNRYPELNKDNRVIKRYYS